MIVGVGFDDAVIFSVNELHKGNALTMPGNARNMIPNMTSFAFDLKGSFLLLLRSEENVKSSIS